MKYSNKNKYDEFVVACMNDNEIEKFINDLNYYSGNRIMLANSIILPKSNKCLYFLKLENIINPDVHDVKFIYNETDMSLITIDSFCPLSRNSRKYLEFVLENEKLKKGEEQKLLNIYLKHTESNQVDIFLEDLNKLNINLSHTIFSYNKKEDKLSIRNNNRFLYRGLFNDKEKEFFSNNEILMTYFCDSYCAINNIDLNLDNYIENSYYYQEKIEYDIEDEETESEKLMFKEKDNYNSPEIIDYIDLKLEEKIQPNNGEYYHKAFNQIFLQIKLDEPIMLVGPAGSGKNHVINQVAKKLDSKMYYTNNASNEFKLTGFIDAGGIYRETEFYKAFKNGGIFFLDEIDTSDPSSLIVINSALANGYMAFPHETVERNENFRMISAANTFGKGANLEYIGRNILDASTLDRFDNIFFDYDENLEKKLYHDKNVLEFMWSFRNAVQEKKIQHIVSTRTIGKVYKKERYNIPLEYTIKSNIIKNLGVDDIDMIINSMNEINHNNKYYKEFIRVRKGM